jgi:hypothetical protein
LVVSAEVVPVLRFAQPAALTIPFAGLSASGHGTEILPAAITGRGLKNFLAAKAFHRGRKKIQRPTPPRPVQPAGRVTRARKTTKKKEELRAIFQEDEEDASPRTPHFQTASFTPFSNRRPQVKPNERAAL